MNSTIETIRKDKCNEFPKLMIDKQRAIVVLFAQNLERGTVVWADRQSTFYNVGDYSLGWDEDDFVKLEDQQIILKN
jgi:hypothetical protein